MAKRETALLSKVFADSEADILTDWQAQLREQGGRMKEGELQAQCRNFLARVKESMGQAGVDVSSGSYDRVRDLLAEFSRSRAVQGFSPTETAMFVFSLKQPLFKQIAKTGGSNAQSVADATWDATLLLDELGLYTMEVFQKTREEVIFRQQREIAELSTPVVKLWEGVLALPLIGTLDSQRTQVVMENLLEGIVANSAEIAIIDITGVPTVDTLVAQHLLKTVAAARLMGADCIVSGIRPQIAQTMVHLGVELDVVTKATLADALLVALDKVGQVVTSRVKA